LGGGVPGICISLVPNVFPSYSHDVPTRFPICSQQHLDFLPHGLPKLALPCIQTGKVGHRGAHLFLFCDSGSKEMFLLGSAQMFLKNW
jgi:hypothetical protein